MRLHFAWYWVQLKTWWRKRRGLCTHPSFAIHYEPRLGYYPAYHPDMAWPRRAWHECNHCHETSKPREVSW